jgi:predicted AlkP superfamily phosphohydrolase/phosphomutase
VAALRRHAGNRLKAWLRARFPGLERRAQASARAVAADWPRTRAWTETGHIFVNTRGVWPEGCVDPGHDREALLAKLAEGLLALRDPISGERAVARVTRGDEQFDGPHADLMPDLLVHWRNDLQVTSLIDADGATVERQNPPELPPGAHHPHGTLLVAGPSFISTDRAPDHCIYDVAPTVLHLLGRAIPSYFDGAVMADLMTSDAAKDVRRRSVNLPHDRGRAPEPGGDETVRRRLRSLGYLE